MIHIGIWISSVMLTQFLFGVPPALTSPEEDAMDSNASNLSFPSSPLVEEGAMIPAKFPTKEEPDPIADSVQPVSIDFKGAAIKDVLQTLSKENRSNFVFPDDIGEKKVFISLRNTPWNQALNAILDTYGLGMVPLKGGVLRIDTLERLNGEKKNIEQIRKNSSILQPTKVMIFRLSYASSDKIIKMIQEMLPALKYDDRIKVQSDERTNSVVVEATLPDLEKVRRIVEKIDLRTPQVKIDIRVLEILKKVDKFLGVNWGGPIRYDRSRGLGFGNMVFPNSATSAFSVDTKAFSNATNGVAFDTHLGSLNNIFELDLRLRMAELASYTRGLQNTNVTVLDNQSASIEAGTEDYFSVPVGLNDNRMSSVKSTLLLKVKPHITADGSVQMNIRISRDSPKELANDKASVSKNITNLETDLLRKSGETAVIGGLYSTSLIRTETGVPFFSSIPILGALFRSKGTMEDKHELMILVTPVIVPLSPEPHPDKVAIKEPIQNSPAPTEAKIENTQNISYNSINENTGKENTNPVPNVSPPNTDLKEKSEYSHEFDNRDFDNLGENYE